MGEVIQLQGDHRSKIRDFLIDPEVGLGLDEKVIKVRISKQSQLFAATC